MSMPWLPLRAWPAHGVATCKGTDLTVRAGNRTQERGCRTCLACPRRGNPQSVGMAVYSNRTQERGCQEWTRSDTTANCTGGYTQERGYDSMRSNHAQERGCRVVDAVRHKANACTHGTGARFAETLARGRADELRDVAVGEAVSLERSIVTAFI